MVKVLECSSKGDKRFSALYARIKLKDGRVDSIENIYQSSKVFKKDGKFYTFDNFKTVKSVQHKKEYELVGFKVNGNMYDKEYLTMWHTALWIRYFEHNPNLIEYIKQFDDFTDCFARPNTVNSQSKVIKELKDYGLQGLKYCVKPLMDLMINTQKNN